MKYLLIILLLFVRCATAWDAPQSLYAPARYVFVADKGSPHIAVVDLFEEKQIDLIKLPTKVDTFAVSTDDGYLAFADRDKTRLYIYNTKTRRFSQIELPSYLYQMMFIPGEGKIAVRLAEQVGVVDYRKNTLALLDAEFPSPGIDFKRETLFTMIFDVVNQTFWILNKQNPVIHHYSYLHPGWHSSKLGNFDGYATGVSAPDGEFIAVNTYQLRSSNKDKTREGIVFFPYNGKVLQTGPMYNGNTLDNPMILPYIDNASRRVYFADRGGNVAVFDLWQNGLLQRINIGFEPTVIRTGWLDQKLIIGGDMSVAVYRAEDLVLEQQFNLPEEVNDIWVTGDSKTALFTMEYHPVLMRYDLQHNLRLPDIKLKGIAEANLIRMGSTNTLCY